MWVTSDGRHRVRVVTTALGAQYELSQWDTDVKGWRLVLETDAIRVLAGYVEMSELSEVPNRESGFLWYVEPCSKPGYDRKRTSRISSFPGCACQPFVSGFRG